MASIPATASRIRTAPESHTPPLPYTSALPEAGGTGEAEENAEGVVVEAPGDDVAVVVAGAPAEDSDDGAAREAGAGACGLRVFCPEGAVEEAALEASVDDAGLLFPAEDSLGPGKEEDAGEELAAEVAGSV